MGGFGQDSGYEPSADELIEVLKNLENLAAADPGLYRTIVDQIKGGAMGAFLQQAGNGQGLGGFQLPQASQYEQQMYDQQQREADIYRQQQEQQIQMQMQQQQLYEEQQRMMQQQEESSMSMSSMQQQQVTSSSSSMRQEQSSSSSMRQEQHSSSSMQQETKQETRVVKQVVQEVKRPAGMSDEEFKQVQRMKRLEAEAQEEVRQTLAAQREAKMKKLHPPAPPPPKEITVVAGDGKTVKVLLGGENELEDCRKQVAEAAGLKHVPLPDFEGTDSAWAGSLKKTNKNRPQAQEENDENPWSGSLRHVEDKRKGKQRKDEENVGGAGNPAWMGTLRHVVHDNKVTKNYGVNQFQSKRYPDEDAGNPFESQGGSNSRPQLPLGPAAIINGSAMSRDEMARREEEEEVERVRANIGSKTVSTALMQVLMPKLLKMHEAKYEPMDKVDAEKIMEEILGMQAGLNPDQQADANEEAEMIIRAIMQEEIDKSIYSKMADDLEVANKRIKKKKTKKVVQASSGITA